MDPRFVPVGVDHQRVLSILRTLFPAADDITIVYSHEVRFFGGPDLQRIFCPRCGSEFPDGWWADMMSHAFESSRFLDLAVTVPCCAATTTLNDLVYDWPTGFARFSLEVRSPGAGKEAIAISPLETALGMPLRVILGRH